MKKFILASASPRRSEILKNAGFDFEVVASQADETIIGKIEPKIVVRMLAKRKANAVLNDVLDSSVVLGCDTIVVLDDKILEKPKDEKDAIKMLSRLSGKTHYVYTGVCITDGAKEKTFVSETEVEFFTLSAKTIENYVKTGEPMDKAGAYGIQGLGSILVKKIWGDYFAVMGLPISKTARELKKFGVECSIL